MAKNPAFPFYANDYLVDTLRWSRGMKSLHIDLMAESWSNKVIQDDNGYPKGLSSEDRLLWDEIRHKWVLTDGVWFNVKLEEARSNRSKFLARQAKNGQKGGRPSKEKPMGFQNLTQTKPKQKPLEDEYEKENELEIIEIGVPSKISIGIKPKYAGESPRRIHDLTEYFRSTGQLSQVASAGWTDRFGPFMNKNPGAVFDDDRHLYNAIKRFEIETPKASRPKRVDLKL